MKNGKKKLARLLAVSLVLILALPPFAAADAVEEVAAPVEEAAPPEAPVEEAEVVEPVEAPEVVEPVEADAPIPEEPGDAGVDSATEAGESAPLPEEVVEPEPGAAPDVFASEAPEEQTEAPDVAIIVEVADEGEIADGGASAVENAEEGSFEDLTAPAPEEADNPSEAAAGEAGPLNAGAVEEECPHDNITDHRTASRTLEVLERDAQKHTIIQETEWEDYCGDCNRWLDSIFNTQTVEDAPHSFQDGKCALCGYICPHDNRTELGERAMVEEEYFDCDAASYDSQPGHRKHTTYEQRIQCEDCGASSLTLRTYEFSDPEAHVYEDGVCTACGSLERNREPTEADGCTHSEIESLGYACHHERWVCENGKCMGYGGFVSLTFRCRSCERRFTRVYPFDAGEPHEHEHDFSDGNDWTFFQQGYCVNCGFCGEDCAHRDAAILEYSVEEIKDIASEALSAYHSYTEVRQARYSCPACGAEFSGAREERRVTEPHTYGDARNADGALLCTICGYAQGCKHIRSIVQYYSYKDGFVDRPVPNEETKATHSYIACTRTAHRLCLNCGCVFMGESEEGTFDEAHSYVEDAGTGQRRCEICGYVAEEPLACADNHWVTNGRELNPHIFRVPRSSYVENFKPAADGHYKVVQQHSDYYCAYCGDLIENDRYDGEDCVIFERHDWVKPGIASESGRCGVCDYVNPCEHGGGRIKTTETKYFNAKPSSSKRHSCVRVVYQWYRCALCLQTLSHGVLEWSANSSAPHEFEENEAGESRCSVCGFTCTHENAEWKNANWQEIEDPDLSGDEGHLVYTCAAREWKCPDCGRSGRAVSEDAADEEMVKHSFGKDPNTGEMVCKVCGRVCGHSDYNVKTRKCKYCGTACAHRSFEGGICLDCGYTCKHGGGREYENYAGISLDNGEGGGTGYGGEAARTRCVPVDEGRHATWTAIIGKVEICSICGEPLGYERIDDAAQRAEIDVEPHSFDLNGVCEACGYETQCRHKNKRVERDWNSSDGEVERVDERVHRIYGGHSSRVVCEDCGSELEDRFGEFDLGYGDFPHEFKLLSNGTAVCEVCGYASDCAHAERKEVTREEREDGGYRDLGAPGHAYYIRTVKDVVCASCGVVIDEGIFAERNEVREPHLTGASGFCPLCGNSDACEHSESYKRYAYAGEVAGAEALEVCEPADQNWHRVNTALYEKTYCKTCEKYLGTELAGEQSAHLEPHDYPESAYEYFDGRNFIGLKKGTVCKTCGYAAKTCSHTSVVFEIIDRSECEYQPEDGEHHWVAGRFEYERRCALCGKLLESGFYDSDANGPLEEEHELYYEDGSIQCEYCGYENTCAHTGDNIEYIPRDDGDCERQVYIDIGNGKHRRILENVLVYGHCKSCGQWLYEYGAPIEGIREPYRETISNEEPHEFDDDGVCKFCGYAGDVVGLRFAEATVQLGVGETYLPKLFIQPASAKATAKISYTSKDKSVFTVDPDTGEIKGKSSGSAKLVAKANGRTAQLNVKVCKKPASFQLNPSKLTLGVGERVALSAKLPKNTYWRVEKWESSAEEVATVKDGVVVPAGVGEATITATLYENVTAACKVTVKPAPTFEAMRISLPEGEDGIIGEGESVQVTAEYADDAAGKITYSSENPAIATVDASGKVKGVKPGSADIAATAYNGEQVWLTVRVKAKPAKIVFSNNPGSLAKGEPWTLAVKLTGANGAESAGSVKFKSDKPGVLAVDKATGELTAQKAGKAKITATTYNQKSASVTIAVGQAADSFELNPSNLTLGVGESAALKAKLPSGRYGHVTSWECQPEGVATVAEGIVTPVSEGSATVTATLFNGAKASCELVACAEPRSDEMKIELAKPVIGVKEVTQAAVNYDRHAEGTYTFASSDAKVATVDANGKVKGVAAGDCEIIATAYNSVVARTPLRVELAPDKVAIENNPKTLGVNEPWSIGASLSRKDGKACAGSVTFSSSAASVLAVDSNTGALKAKKAGSAKITAVSQNGAKASCTITVKKAPTSIRLMKDKVALSADSSLTMGVGEELTLAAKLSSDSFGHVQWTSTAPGTVFVEGGKLRALNTGSAVITATVYNSKEAESPLSASCAVEVKPAPESEDMELRFPGVGCAPEIEKRTLGVGEEMTATVVFQNGTGGGCEFSASNDRVAVGSDGTIRGVKARTVEIAATAYNGAAVAGETITVVAKPATAALTNKPSSLTLGEPAGALGVTLKDKNKKIVTGVEYAFESDNPDVLDVDPKTGALTSKAGGKAKITVRAYNGVSASATISVVDPLLPTKVSLDPKGTIMWDFDSQAGEPLKLTATISPATAAGCGVEWSSSAKRVATVDDAGNVTIVGLGTAKITAAAKTRSVEGKVVKASVTINVTNLLSQVLKIVNQERAKNGAKPLQLDSNLNRCAAIRAKEIVSKFAHVRPNGKPFYSISDGDDVGGENIARGPATAKDVMSLWMNSPGHRANILSADYGYLGVGVYTQGGNTYWVQLFGWGGSWGL